MSVKIFKKHRLPVVYNVADYQAALAKGEMVYLSDKQGTFVCYPVLNIEGLSIEKEMAFLNRCDAELRRATKTHDADGVAEWKDELEVLLLHTRQPAIRHLASELLGI